VETFVRLRSAGLDGLALGMINYVDDFPAIRDELLPRMQRLGLREAGASIPGNLSFRGADAGKFTQPA